MRDGLTTFIESYRDSFSRGASAVAEFYSEPSVIAGMGVVQVSPTRHDTARLFAEGDARDRARGWARSDIVKIDVQPLGAASALVTVQWADKGACEELLWTTTVSYNVYRR